MKKTMQRSMQIYDTTLRDGTQSKDINLTVKDKLSIVELLDSAGIDYIELGWPGSNPKDMETFLKASALKLKHSKISAFCSTRRKDITADQDPNLNAAIISKAKIACIFGKTWLNHITNQLKTTPKENLTAIKDSISYLKKHMQEVFYDAEHFFDGYKDNSKYALECIRVASESGADVIVLCDTNGGCLPDEIKKIVKEVRSFLPKAKLGIHCHNDSGCAVANSLICAKDITQIHGTINGFGERTGNADLCQIIPALHLKLDIKTNFMLNNLNRISEFVYTLANMKETPNQPYVGKNAFSHKGGIHVDAISKGAIYEHIDPSLVGNKREIILSDLSGSANIVEILKEYGIKVDKKSENVKAMLQEVKEMEKKGYNIADIEAEKFLLVNRHFIKRCPFTVLDWKISTEFKNGKETSVCRLNGKSKEKKYEMEASVDAGPVDAGYQALKNLIGTKHPEIRNIKLVNYKVMIAEDKGPESSVRVYIEFKNHDIEFATIGVSQNIIEASMVAIEKGFNYYLLKNNLN
jgi:2-isopropylmalate synthase